jgi:Zn-dependent M28 family amino/carboxypeptidase
MKSKVPGSLRLAGLVLLALWGCASESPLKDPPLERLSALSAQVDGALLMDTVRELVDAHRHDTPLDCTGLGGDRYPPYCHLTREQAGALVQTRLEALGLSVRRNTFSSSDYPTSNIIADLPGTTHPEEVVLVGAHFDAFYAGADDNTTGVAAVLELARVLSQQRYPRTLRFVGFDLEELGLIGSTRYITTQSGPERIVASLVFDGIGYFDSRPGSQRSLPGLPTPSAGDFLAVIGNGASSGRAAELYALNQELDLLPVVPLLAPGDGTSPVTGSLLRSDHTPFWLTGHEALFLTDTANFRNPHYHEDTDTVDTVDPDGFQRVVRLSAVTLAYWAGGPQ